MIVKWFLELVGLLVHAVLLVVPPIPVPSWVSDVKGLFETFFGYVAGLSAWAPWTLMVTVATAVLACVVIGFGIKAGRIALSFVTLGGGSAG